MKKSPYRVCHLAKYYPPVPGGIETHVQTLARAQAALGCEVKVICVNGLDAEGHQAWATRTHYEQDQVVQVVRLGRLFSLARFDVCPSVVRQLSQLSTDAYDVIHLHTPNPTMLLGWAIAWLLAGLRQQVVPPLVITHHSDIIRQRLLKYALRPIEYLAYQQAICIFTNSRRYLEGSKFLRAFTPQVKTLPMGLDCLAYRQPSLAALHHANQLRQQYGAPLWLAVGRLVYYKALHLAIEALQWVPGVLVIIGTGPQEEPLKALAGRLGLAHRIVWQGQVTEAELVGAYQAATALWFPSNVRSEGFGLVQIEAMASGCPVINAEIPGSGVPWVSRHEKEGLTVPLNDAIALAQAAQRLLTEPGLRQRLAGASRQRAQEFDHLVMARRSLEIYEQALDPAILDVKTEPWVREVGE